MAIYKYNIYKIEKHREKALVEKLVSVGLKQTGELEESGYQMKFFFSTQPDEVDIWWINLYQDFIKGVDLPKNKIYFGALLLSSPDTCYAISFGKSHFYLRPFCDSDFGLNLAERIANPDSLRIKHSRFYKSRKSKTIIAYHAGGAEMDYDSGESLHYLKAGTIDDSLWGKVASFGSSVLLHLDITPVELPHLIDRIEEALQQPPLFTLPRATLVREENEIKNLDRKLVRSILSYAPSSEVGIEEFSLSGVNFIFSDANEYSLYRRGRKREKINIGHNLSIEALLDFIHSQSISLDEEIDNILVEVRNPYGRNRSEPLKKFLDFIDDENRYCLIDGKWYKFSLSYVEFLKREVDKLAIEYEPRFDIIGEPISEEQFNRIRAEQDGFLNYDRTIVSIDGKYRVEKVDLLKEDSLYFVKIGKPQKLVYVIDQSLILLKILQNQDGRLEIEGHTIRIDYIYLWLVLERNTDIQKLSDINSIILHILTLLN